MKDISTHNIRGRWRLLPGAVVIALLAGCASYQPQPLPRHVNLSASVDQLITPDLAGTVNPEDGLNLAAVAILAVRNNPDLKVKRKQLGVAQARLYSTGLLPDPQLSANLDHPTGNAMGAVDAFGMGLDYDVISLINRGARVEGARQSSLQARLELMWLQWQVSQQARSLAVRLSGQQQQIDLLYEMRDLYRQRYQRSLEAVTRGDLTIAAAGTDLTALLDTLSQINQLEQARNDSSHALNLLLGLDPSAQLPIRLGPLPKLPDPHELRRQLESFARRRPDLLALQAGYRSQESKVRASILSQFPSFSIGINRARDTGDLYTIGFSISLNLPLFSANRGAIAVERATREQLREEYQARLDQAAVDVDRLIRLQGLVAAQQLQLDEYLPALKQMVDRGRKAYQHGDIDALTFLHMESTWISKRQEQISLDQTQRENLIALQTLLALSTEGTARTSNVSEGDLP